MAILLVLRGNLESCLGELGCARERQKTRSKELKLIPFSVARSGQRAVFRCHDDEGKFQIRDELRDFARFAVPELCQIATRAWVEVRSMCLKIIGNQGNLMAQSFRIGSLARLCSTPELRPRRLDAAHLLKACAGFKGKVQPVAEF